jgi:stress-induced morphogen
MPGTPGRSGTGKDTAMAMERDTLETYLREAFPDAVITLKDLAGDNDHWSAEIVSEQFRGKSRVAQHQLVYAALKGRMGGQLHALALSTRAPA